MGNRKDLFKHAYIAEREKTLSKPTNMTNVSSRLCYAPPETEKRAPKTNA